MADGSRGPQLASVLIFLLVSSIVAVGLRCYTMLVILKRFFVEDWLTLVAIVLYCVYSAFGLLGVKYGLASHVDDVAPEDRVKARFWQFMCQAIYVVLSVLTKYIVGIFLLRICVHQRWKVVTIWCMLVAATIFGTFLFFIALFQCHPIAWYWWRYDSTPPFQGECNATTLATIPSYIAALLNCVVDWTLGLIIPASIVWTVQMEIRMKVSVVAVLALGLIASIATIARIPYAKDLLQSSDYLYNFSDLAIWTTVEIGLAITASSLAKLKPLLRRLRIFGTMTSGNGSRLHPPPGQVLPIRTGDDYSKASKKPANYIHITPHKFSEVDSNRIKTTGGKWAKDSDVLENDIEMGDMSDRRT